MNNQMNDDAALLSKVFLLLSGVFVLYHVPVHFEYYKCYFEKNFSFRQLRKVFSKYIENLTCHILLILPVIFIITYLIINSFWLSLLLTFYLLIEKVFDEIQRYLQFDKHFISWSNVFLLKTIVPIVITIVAIQLNFPYPIEFFIFLTILTIILILFTNVKISLLKFITKNIFYKISIKKIRIYIKVLKDKYFLKFLQGISTSNILNIDKWLAAILYTKSLLSELTLMSQISNGIAIGMNYATIANRRSELLKSSNTLSTLLLGWKVPIIAIVLAIIVLVIVFNLSIVTTSIKELNYLMLFFIIAAYTVYSISEPLTEYLFWNANMKTLLLLDSMYFIFVSICGVFLYFQNEYINIPIYFFIAHSIRCIAQMILVKKLESCQ